MTSTLSLCQCSLFFYFTLVKLWKLCFKKKKIVTTLWIVSWKKGAEVKLNPRACKYIDRPSGGSIWWSRCKSRLVKMKTLSQSLCGYKSLHSFPSGRLFELSPHCDTSINQMKSKMPFDVHDPNLYYHSLLTLSKTGRAVASWGSEVLHQGLLYFALKREKNL